MYFETRARRVAAWWVGLFAFAGCCAHAEEAAAPRWEVTIGASGKHNEHGWKIALPEAEIQYQWSERIELTSKISWALIHPAGAPAKSGPGTGEIGLKWLVWEDAQTGFAMALCPQVARFVSRSSVRRGIVSAQREFVLPIETKFTAAGVEFELTTGRNFIEHGPDEWMLELKAIRPCLPQADCTLTLERKFVPSEPSRTLVKPGVDWKLNDAVTLKTALGREVGRRDADRKDLVLSAGLKIAF